MLRATLLAAIALLTFVTPRPADANGSLGTPITGASLDAMWPIRVEVEIVRLATDDESGERVILPRQHATVPDGHQLELHSVVLTEQGRREFAIDVTAHHHPGDAVELEYALRVHEARWVPIDASAYLLHRLQLARVLQLTPSLLKIARADIVSVQHRAHHRQVEIDGELHEIRIFARSARG